MYVRFIKYVLHVTWDQMQHWLLSSKLSWMKEFKMIIFNLFPIYTTRIHYLFTSIFEIYLNNYFGEKRKKKALFN